MGDRVVIRSECCFCRKCTGRGLPRGSLNHACLCYGVSEQSHHQASSIDTELPYFHVDNQPGWQIQKLQNVLVFYRIFVYSVHVVSVHMCDQISLKRRWCGSGLTYPATPEAAWCPPDAYSSLWFHNLYTSVFVIKIWIQYIVIVLLICVQPIIFQVSMVHRKSYGSGSTWWQLKLLRCPPGSTFLIYTI